MHEEAGELQFREVLNSWLIGLARSMQGIGQQDQAIGQVRRFGAQHGGLASTVTLAAEEDTARAEVARCGDGVSEALAIACGVAGARGAVGAGVAEREIASQDVESVSGEIFGECDQQDGLGVAAGAVSEHYGGGGIGGRAMEESANWGVERGVDERLLCGINRHLSRFSCAIEFV